MPSDEFHSGSADSTIPTPSRSPPGRRAFPSYLRQDEYTSAVPDHDDERPLPIAMRGHDRNSNLVPPSPSSLTRRLVSISPRISPASTRPSSRGPVTPIEPSPLSFEDKFDESTTDGSCTVVISPQSQPAVLSPHMQPTALECAMPPPPSGVKDIESVDDDAALRESIRSVWRLWKMSRRSDADADNKETFLRVAREVVEIP